MAADNRKRICTLIQLPPILLTRHRPRCATVRMSAEPRGEDQDSNGRDPADDPDDILQSMVHAAIELIPGVEQGSVSGAQHERGRALAPVQHPRVRGQRRKHALVPSGDDQAGYSGLCPAVTFSSSRTAAGGVPIPNGRPPSSSRPCALIQPDRSGPLGTICVGLMSSWTM